MRQRKEFLVITFSETAEAMAAEKLFLGRGIPGRIIPIPRQLKTGCGLSWRTEMDQMEAASAALLSEGIHYQEMSPVMLWV